MNAIGGYFELELRRGTNEFHTTPYQYKSARSALHHILAIKKPSLVYIPFYTCDALLEPFEAADINFEFYHINHHLDPETRPQLGKNEYFIYVNYFGVKNDTVNELSALYGDQLIIDGSQAFFMKGNGQSWLYNSCRKFFGVPDGSYLYTPANEQVSVLTDAHEGYLTDHLIKRFNGHPTEGYASFLKNNDLCDSQLAHMSKLSDYLLSHVNYEQAIEQRIDNYRFLDSIFADQNMLKTELRDNVPMVYPLLLREKINKTHLYEQKLYIPSFWNDTLARDITGFEFEQFLTSHLLPLPVDHRYTLNDMKQIAHIVRAVMNSVPSDSTVL